MEQRDYVEGGFILLSRKLENDGSTFQYCRNNNERWMFIKCLLMANYKDNIWNGIEIRRGQFVTSIENFAKESGTSLWKVRGFWHFLEKLGFLTRKTTNKYTVITILNYDRYQRLENYLNGEITSKTTNKPQTNHNNERIIKKEKEINGGFEKIFGFNPERVIKTIE